MGSRWPPPVGPGDVFETVRVVDVVDVPARTVGRSVAAPLTVSGGPERRRVVREVLCRRVLLWGRLVLIDETGRVWCDHCHRFVDVAELGSARNVHPVGITRRSGRLLPMDDDD